MRRWTCSQTCSLRKISIRSNYYACRMTGIDLLVSTSTLLHSKPWVNKISTYVHARPVYSKQIYVAETLRMSGKRSTINASRGVTFNRLFTFQHSRGPLWQSSTSTMISPNS